MTQTLFYMSLNYDFKNLFFFINFRTPTVHNYLAAFDCEPDPAIFTLINGKLSKTWRGIFFDLSNYKQLILRRLE